MSVDIGGCISLQNFFLKYGETGELKLGNEVVLLVKKTPPKNTHITDNTIADYHHLRDFLKTMLKDFAELFVITEDLYKISLQERTYLVQILCYE